MTTVADLIAHLQTLPQDAIVQCLAEKQGSWNDFIEWVDLNISDHVNVIDLRGNQFVKPESSNFNKVFVEIGDK